MSVKFRNGFTLIELLVLMAVLGVVAAIAVPNFSRLIESNQLTTTTNDLVGALNTARAEAVRLGGPVSLVPNPTFTESYQVTDGGSVISEFQGASGQFTIALTNGGNPRFGATGLLLSGGSEFSVCRASGEDGTRVRITAGGQIRSARITCP
ncbi:MULTISPECIES: GspH/FimT family pseudopilin [unclassified Marinobacter]|uniref:GspH/FimT family pseudopilin n=1 Tax=unclassified Marinobacter TaxID=83889 RepID=UPI0026E1595E|nr:MULTISPECIES: GspH/FimT family pseudopilin [unclassified Marinobacter]MDO6443951.1 GspH/FimT family pseudopilin [Marinobacter sp. 2_MG-2023]MDO6825160.1 GspH/FimT family pseudopilin [Marinobacter sp. 1_MG-2023]